MTLSTGSHSASRPTSCPGLVPVARTSPHRELDQQLDRIESHQVAVGTLSVKCPQPCQEPCQGPESLDRRRLPRRYVNAPRRTTHLACWRVADTLTTGCPGTMSQWNTRSALSTSTSSPPISRCRSRRSTPGATGERDRRRFGWAGTSATGGVMSNGGSRDASSPLRLSRCRPHDVVSAEEDDGDTRESAMARTTIDRRDNGRYRARYQGPDGRWRSRTFDRRIDAQRWLNNELVKLNRSEWVDPRAQPLLGVVGPDLTPVGFGEPGERQDLSSGVVEMLGSVARPTS